MRHIRPPGPLQLCYIGVKVSSDDDGDSEGDGDGNDNGDVDDDSDSDGDGVDIVDIWLATSSKLSGSLGRITLGAISSSKFSMAEAESTRSSKSGLGSVTRDGKGMTVTGPGASSSSSFPSISQLALVANRGFGLEHKVNESSVAASVAS